MSAPEIMFEARLWWEAFVFVSSVVDFVTPAVGPGFEKCSSERLRERSP